jgi:hypothetical protein
MYVEVGDFDVFRKGEGKKEREESHELNGRPDAMIVMGSNFGDLLCAGNASSGRIERVSPMCKTRGTSPFSSCSAKSALS